MDVYNDKQPYGRQQWKTTKPYSWLKKKRHEY